jgi:cob(I)alamin adenosyltransferase
MNMTKFYTQTGDDGYTGLLGEGRAPKYNQRIEAIGALDEANAALGIARSICLVQSTASILLAAQKDLYYIMAEIAALPENASKFRKISVDHVEWLESQIDDLSDKISIPDGFIVPGDSKSGAVIDMARTIIRRAERHIAYLFHQKEVENRELLRYMNRLSSLCFVLELLEIQASGFSTPTLAKE